MRCKEVNKLMLPLNDGDLSNQLAADVAKHLGECSKCNSLYQSILPVYSIIEAEKDEFQPDHFLSARVLAIASPRRHQHQGFSVSRYIAFPGLVAAGLALGIVIGSLLVSQSPLSADQVNVEVIDQLAAEYMPTYENNPYAFFISENE